MSIKFDILTFLALAATRKESVKSKYIAQEISNPSKIISPRSVVLSLRSLEKKRHVVGSEDLLTIHNVRFWEITKQGCDYMLDIVPDAMLFKDAKQNAIDANDMVVFEYNPEVSRYELVHKSK